MTKKILRLTLLLVAIYCGQVAKGQSGFEAFTHPIGLLPQKVSIYHSPDVYNKEIESDKEAGWIVRVYERRGNYLKIDIEELEMRGVWIHCGDVGVVIQNYDSLQIPLYSSIRNINCDTTYITKSYMAIVYDYVDPYVFVRIEDKNTIYGWIEKKYLCGSPYTTCN